jgi:hypothetical protein
MGWVWERSTERTALGLALLDGVFVNSFLGIPPGGSLTSSLLLLGTVTEENTGFLDSYTAQASINTNSF